MAYYPRRSSNQGSFKPRFQPQQQAPRPGSILYRVPFEALSHFQQATVREAEHGTDHLVVEAVAGSGKTEDILHMLGAYKRAFPHRSVLCVAFNNNIKSVLAAKIPLSVADVMTAHGLGYGSPSATRSGLGGAAYSLCGNWGQGKPGSLDLQGPDGQLMHTLVSSRHGSEPETYPDRAEICRLVSLCKTRLAGLAPAGWDAPAESIEEVIERHEIQFNQFKVPEVMATVEWILHHTKSQPGVVQIRARGGKTFEKKAVTFDDQIWLPLMHGWPLPQYDLILGDEWQDMSPARFALIMRALKPGGRLIAVGDRFQAIYRFAGADVDALPQTIEKLGAKVLPLSITYRCAKKIVAEAQQYNEQIQAGENAEEGTVDTLGADQVSSVVQTGDVIISRTNAPLIRFFFMLAKQGKRVVMLGRDYGLRLANRIKSWRVQVEKKGGSFTGAELLACNDVWLAEALEKAGDNGSRQTQATDEHGTIAALAEDLGCPLSSEDAAEEVITRCFKLFSADGDASKDAITLSSTHKFKGDERDRVFMLTETYRPGATQEETNLAYVAVTRARRHLTYVTGIKALSGK